MIDVDKETVNLYVDLDGTLTPSDPIYNKILNSGDLNWQELECLDDERRFAAMRCASRAGLRGHNLPVTILFYLMFLIRSD
ncbi:MAG: hypothetical protein ACI8P9_004699 [Parasphingorhabdus sp.]|jgi:hypothetical protein